MAPETISVSEQAGAATPSLDLSVRRVGLLLLAPALVFVAVLAFPLSQAIQGLAAYLPLHTFMETFAIVVSALVFGVGWHAYSAERPGYIALLACAFLGVGLLDFAHAMSFQGMPDFVTAAGPEKAIYFWLAARFLGAAALFFVALLGGRSFPAAGRSRYGMLVGSLAFTGLVYWAVLFRQEALPRAFIAGVGLTPFKVATEWLVIAILLVTAGLLLARRREDCHCQREYLMAAVAVMALSELCFTLYSRVTDAFNLLGHVYKVLAYLFIYRAVFVAGVREPYEQLHRSRRAIWREKERAQVTLESIGDAVITTDAAGRVEHLNQVAEAFTGWHSAEARGKSLEAVFNVVNEHTRAPAENPLVACLRGGRVVGLANHTVLIGRDGREFAIEDSAAPIFDRDGSIVGAILVFHDVSARRKDQAALRENEERLRTLINAMPDIVCFKDGRGRWLEANDFDLRLFRIENVPYRGKKDSELAEFSGFYRDAFLACEASDEVAWRAGGPSRGEEAIPRPDGPPMVFDVIKVPLFNPDGSRHGLVVVGRDITESSRLRTEKQQLVTILEATPDFVGISTVDGRRVHLNRAGRSMLGIGEDEDVTTMGMFDAYPEWVHPLLADEAIPTAVRDGVWNGETALLSRDGREIPVSQVIIAHTDADGKVAFLSTIARDVSERKHFETRLAHQAHHDALTGLPNRLLLHDRLGQALARAGREGKQVAVMFLDLDRFKNINDTLGHEVGDALLEGVAQRLTTCLRDGDTIARWGGDEFTLVLPDLKWGQDAVPAAEKVIEAISRPFVIGERELFVNVSIGITLYPSDEKSVEGLIKNADIAMYRAKEQGGNNYQFYRADMNARALERLALENSLRKALERQELLLYFQPQVDIVSGRVVGMEALVRWRHPDLGLVSPAQFIPLAEETGLIVPIGEWVLREACRQNKAWRDAGYAPLRMAVNLSARQFRQQNLVEITAAVLNESGLHPDGLELELTESYIMQNPETAITVLRDLKAMGVHLSIDDFGTGYSSLSYLKRFPIDTLKIDQSFVRDITTDPDDAAITSAIIAMAHTLKLEVVGEGVEAPEQLAFLKELGCDRMQGYFFSRPIPAEDIPRLLHV